MPTFKEQVAQFEKDRARTAKEVAESIRAVGPQFSDADAKAIRNAEKNAAEGITPDPSRNIVEGK
jgi:hypothetical protein